MTKNSPIPSIREQVLNLNFDLKAETFATHLLEDGVEMDINLSDYFKRRFGKDITRIGEVREGEKLEVHLSRRSFYNIFPERFFHTSYSSTAFVETMVADYKNRKLEQEQARKFFKPLETEFFLHRVAIERQEDAIFQALGSPELAEFLTGLWEIDANIPKRMASKLLKTMPFMYKIAGNLALLQSTLENIIEERIEIERDFVSLSYPAVGTSWQLGVNMATVGLSKTFLPKYIFTIKDIKRSETIADYLPEGRIISVVEFFLQHTLPFESDYEINFTLGASKTEFILSEVDYSGRLGVSTTI